MTRRTRRRLAITALFAWLLALEVLPSLHLATHDETAHHHDADGNIVLDAPHSHGGHTHTHLHAARDHKSSGHGWNAPRDHGANSFAHRTAALKPPGAIVTSPLPVAIRPTYIVNGESPALRSIAATRPRARGPPTHVA